MDENVNSPRLRAYHGEPAGDMPDYLPQVRAALAEVRRLHNCQAAESAAWAAWAAEFKAERDELLRILRETTQ